MSRIPGCEIARAVSILLLISSLAGCGKDAPTGPSYNYAGTWSGAFEDHSVILTNGKALACPFTFEVASDGTAQGSGERTLPINPVSSLTSSITMDVLVLPDGAVEGSGTWSFTMPGTNIEESGLVIGQLDIKSGFGSGVLQIEQQGLLWHFPWHVKLEGR